MNTETFEPQQLALYYSPYCPYCHRVLNAMVELGLNPDLVAATADGIALKNTAANREYAQELKQGGGKSTVPCLSISVGENTRWLYESLDIIEFLKTKLKLN